MKEEDWWWRDERKRREDKRGRNEFDGYELFSMTDLTPRAQDYLVRVYGTLAMTAAVSALTLAASIYRLIPDDSSGIGTLLSFAMLLGVQFSRGVVSERWRLGGLLAFAFLQGWQVGPLSRSVFDLDPEIILNAVIATVLAFVSFTGAAVFSRRRSFMYLGGLLSVATLVLLGTSLFSIMFDFSLYLGLFVFCFYIIYDTQLMIERVEQSAEIADRLGVDGAMQLFTDLMGVFVRIMVILSKLNKPKRKERKRE